MIWNGRWRRKRRIRGRAKREYKTDKEKTDDVYDATWGYERSGVSSQPGTINASTLDRTVGSARRPRRGVRPISIQIGQSPTPRPFGGGQDGAGAAAQVKFCPTLALCYGLCVLWEATWRAVRVSRWPLFSSLFFLQASCGAACYTLLLALLRSVLYYTIPRSFRKTADPCTSHYRGAWRGSTNHFMPRTYE